MLGQTIISKNLRVFRENNPNFKIRFVRHFDAEDYLKSYLILHA